MIKRVVSLHSVDKIKRFNKITCEFNVEIDLASSRYVVDAKSILGIFSLDLSKDLDLLIHVNNAEDEKEAAIYLEKIAEFLAK